MEKIAKEEKRIVRKVEKQEMSIKKSKRKEREGKRKQTVREKGSLPGKKEEH